MCAKSAALDRPYLKTPTSDGTVKSERSKRGTGGLTMAEYIERKSFLRWVGEFRPGDPALASAVYNFPTADVVPAFHGYKHGLTRGECMRRARNRAEMSIRQLSKLSGVPGGTISMLENNTSRCGRIDTLELLADALHISVDEYVGHYR